MAEEAPKRRTRARLLLLTLVLVAVSLVGLVICAVLFAQQASASRELTQREESLSSRQRNLQALLGSLVEAHEAQRHFLSTGNQASLEAYDAAVQTAVPMAEGLQATTAATDASPSASNGAGSLIGMLLSNLAQGVAAKTGRASAAALAIASDSTRALANETRAQLRNLSEVVEIEREGLATSIAAGEARSHRLLLLSISFLAAFLCLSCGMLVSAWRARRVSEQVVLDNAQRMHAILQDQSELIAQSREDITARKDAERALRELTDITEATPDLILQADSEGTVSYLNPALRRAMDMGQHASALQMKLDWLMSPQTSTHLTSAIARAVQEHGIWRGEGAVRVANQRALPVSNLVIGHRDATGTVIRYSAVMRDISSEVETRRLLRLQTSTLASVTEAIPAVVAVMDAQERLQFANHAAELWFGKPREDMIGQTQAELLGAEDYARSKPWIARVLNGETVGFEKDYPHRHPPTHMAVSFIPLLLDDGRVDGFVVVAQDITHHRLEAARLLQMAARDPLTSLLNRAGFESFLTKAMEAAEPEHLALLYIDLDHFKPVNDQHGHAAGDALLKQFSDRLRGLVRPTDAVARLGGDEFAIVLTGVRSMSNVETIADKILEVARRPFDLEGCEVSIGASVGLAHDASGDDEMSAFVARADTMLYLAKAAGRGKRL